MKTQMTLAKILALAAVSTLAAGVARADFSSYSTNSLPGVITVPKFNPTLGHLDSITFSMTGHVQGRSQVENLGPASGPEVKLTLGSSLALTRPGGGAPLVVATPIVINTFTLGAFDGVFDYAGASGATFSGLTGSKFNQFSYASDADKALFTGTGNTDLLLSAVVFSHINVGSPVVSHFDTETRALVTVVYNYSRSSAVPEPRVYGAVGALLCAGFAMLRQLRSKKS